MRRENHAVRCGLLRCRFGLAGTYLVCTWLCGCGSWDITSRDWKAKDVFAQPPDPLVVLRDSPEGDKRAKAYAALKEPQFNGGSAKDQDKMVEILTVGAKTEHQFYTRLMAVRKLGEFKDPRVVPALIEAYYAASTFRSDFSTLLRCESLAGLGKVGHPSGTELLVKVLGQGPMEGPEQDRQRAMDERIAAARALGHFPQYRATEALVQVLKTDKDIALRTCVHQSLQASTGQNLPMDYQVWNDFLHSDRAREGESAPNKNKSFVDLLLTTFSSKP